MPRPLPLSSPLREKQFIFDNWGLSEDSDDDKTTMTTSGAGSSYAQSVVVKIEDDDDRRAAKPRLSEAEIKHRRKSKAFTVAATAARAEKEKKALEKQARRERKERKRREREEKETREQETREQETREKETREQEIREQKEHQQRQAKKRALPDNAEVIDLTLPKVTPIPPPQIPPPPPPRTQWTVEYMRRSGTLRRTASNPLPESQNKKRKHTAESASSSFGDKSTHGKSPAKVPASSGSTRSGDLFSGLSFYYLPDAAFGARKLRIAKAQQHGATWVRSLDEATHVIVDKPFKWTEIASAVQGRRPDAIVVYDEYPLDCIGFRCLLSPTQRRYQIPGRPDPEAEREEQKRERERRRHEKGKGKEVKREDKGQEGKREDKGREWEREWEREREQERGQGNAHGHENTPDHWAYLIKADRHTNRRFVVAGPSSRSREPEQMIRQRRKRV